MQNYDEYQEYNQGFDYPGALYGATPVPDGFVVSADGVCEVGKNGKTEIISAPIWVISLTKGGAGWGRIFKFFDHDGSVVELSIPASKLHEGSSLIGELANSGLRIIPGKERRLMTYLALSEPRGRVHWDDDDDDNRNPGCHVIEAVRAFLVKHAGRFQNLNWTGADVPNRAGFRDSKERRWLFAKESLIEAGLGEDPVKIARILRDAGHLFTNDRKLMAVMTTSLGRGRWYVVKDSIEGAHE